MNNVPAQSEPGQGVTNDTPKTDAEILRDLSRQVAWLTAQLTRRFKLEELSDDAEDDEEEAPDIDTEDESASGPLGHLAIRDDGAVLVSLEDASDRDLEGREVVSFMVLYSDEIDLAREEVDAALTSAAARLVGALPMKLLSERQPHPHAAVQSPAAE